ncbi:MAG: hypothetical protein FJ276_30390 [Planctomycetes bacterium]|nr:hypothetical protein [Planctomycetota bacterium]
MTVRADRAAASEAGAISAEREEPAVELTRPLLDASLLPWRSFMLSNQRPNGLFRYRFHFLTQQSSLEQNAVRQAGVLWDWL